MQDFSLLSFEALLDFAAGRYQLSDGILIALITAILVPAEVSPHEFKLIHF